MRFASASGHGVRFASASGHGVRFASASGHGVRFASASGHGVRFASASGHGVRFASASGHGVRLLLLAPPGAGKGTQGERLAAWSGARHIAAGDLLRAQARAGGPLGREIADHQARGDLVPDQIVLDALTPAVTEAAAHGGYILDGFPRNLPQAIAAAELAARLGVTLHAAIYLHAPDPVLTRRLLDRASRADVPMTRPT